MSFTGDARHLNPHQGPRCRSCQTTEARCAFNYECCPGCTHFRHLDATGNEPPKPAPVIPVDHSICFTCKRCAEVRRAYDRGRKRAAYRRVS